MANYEFMIQMEHYNHELQPIEVSKSDKAKPERLLSAKEMTRHRGGLGSIGWLVDLVHNFHSISQKKRRRTNDATILDMLR